MVLFKAKNYLDELDLIIKNKFEKLETEKKLAIINVGKNKASHKYVEIKQKVANHYGIEIELFEFKNSVRKKELITKLEDLSQDNEYGGILVQYPLPPKFTFEEVSKSISSDKDIDFFTSHNLGEFYNNFGEDFAPPVVRSLDFLCNTFKLDFKGKHYMVLGQGRLVGRPISTYLLNKEATVTAVNEYTEDVPQEIKDVDVLICAAGAPNAIKGQMLKRGACVIDFSYGDSERPGVGDFDMSSQIDHLNIVSAVPGGMGPLTVRFLFLNFLEFVERKFYL